MHDEVDAVVERLELAVGDERRDLDDHVAADVEAGHLEIEPHEPVVGRRRVVPVAVRIVAHRVRLMNRPVAPMRGSVASSSLVGPRVHAAAARRRRPRRVARDPRSAAATGWSSGSRCPSPARPIPIADRDAFRARCGAWERQRQFDTAYGFGIFLRDGTLVGEVSLGSVLRGPFQSCFIGYWIDEAHAGCGYMPEAVALVIRYGFEELGLHRMEAAIVPRNAKSRRVADKLGLRDEGTATRFLQIQGVWEDHVRYAITREEWDERRAGVRERSSSR